MKALLNTCLAIILVLGLTAGAALAGEVKIALDSPADLKKSGTYVWAHYFGEALKASGVKVKEFPRDALGGEEEKLDQVSQGLLEVSMSDLAKAAQLDKTIFGFHLPYMFDSIEHMDKVVYGTDLMAKVNAATTKKGVRILALVPVGDFGGLANTKKPIKTPADLKGPPHPGHGQGPGQVHRGLGSQHGHHPLGRDLQLAPDRRGRRLPEPGHRAGAVQAHRSAEVFFRH